ncbi:MAG: hypothetical protein M0Q51_03065 [Bacteroidales bacterium]|nr:hypothetical protein [Bacteroidales bacterium]
MKKVVILSFLFLFCFSFLAGAQDIIYKKDGSKEEAKIILIGEKEIQYKKFSNLAGPVYSLDKNDILLITYENGEYETISKTENVEKPDKIDLRKDFAKNILSHDLFDLVFMDFTVSYERLLSNGIVGFKIPLSVCFDRYDESSNFNFNNIFFSGLGLNFYPTGQGKWRYFVGPQVRIGYGWESSWVTYWDESGNYLYDEEVKNEGLYTKFFVNNGIIFTPIKNFSFSMIGSIGIRYFPGASYDYDTVRPDGDFSINISYRF